MLPAYDFCVQFCLLALIDFNILLIKLFLALLDEFISTQIWQLLLKSFSLALQGPQVDGSLLHQLVPVILAFFARLDDLHLILFLNIGLEDERVLLHHQE